MSGITSWGDYASLASSQGVDQDAVIGGFQSAADVSDLNKALVAGSDINNPGAAYGEGFPLRVESLDSTMYVTSYKATDVRFWRMLYKDRAYNTVEEFNRLDEYGSSESIFMPEGDLPIEDDSKYSRQYSKVKFMGVVRRVTHVMAMVKSAGGDAVARETVNGTLAILRSLERCLFTGDENLIPEQFDGLETLLVKAFDSSLAEDGQYLGYESDNVIDLRGEPLSEDFVIDMAERLVAEPNYGRPNKLWIPTGPIKDLSKIMYPKERIALPSDEGLAGVSVTGIRTPFGDVGFEPDIFLPDSVKPSASGVGKMAFRPGVPVLAAPTSPVYAGSNQTFFGASDAGTYYYKVVAGSRYGKSAPATSSSVTVSAGDEVQIDVTDVGPDTTYFEISRSSKDGAADTCKTMMRVKRSSSPQTIHDLNRFLPGCSKGYMNTQDPEVMKWKQLAPFTKIPLGMLDSSIRWMQLLYGGLQVMAPKKCGVLINIGKLQTGVNA